MPTIRIAAPGDLLFISGATPLPTNSRTTSPGTIIRGNRGADAADDEENIKGILAPRGAA
jgi:hypothetical protein